MAGCMLNLTNNKVINAVLLIMELFKNIVVELIIYCM